MPPVSRPWGWKRERDLLFHLPLRYEDRTRLTPLNRVRVGLTVQVEGKVVHQEIRYGRRRMLLATLADDHGQIVLRFFRFFPSQQRMLKEGQHVRCYGEARFGPEGFELVHPQCQAFRAGEMLPLPESLSPVYPTTQGLAQATLQRLVNLAVQRLREWSARIDRSAAGPCPAARSEDSVADRSCTGRR